MSSPDIEEEPVDSDYKGPTHADNRPIRWRGDRAHLAGVLHEIQLWQTRGRVNVLVPWILVLGGGGYTKPT